MINREEVKALLIGMLMVMLITWITLPTEEELKLNAECIKHCKKEIKKGNTDIAVYSSYTYFRAISACYEECVEEKDDTKH